MAWRRLDLGRIEVSIDALRNACLLRASGWLCDEPLTEEAARHLLDGYREVDALLAAEVDLFAYGESWRILELNHLVLCGAAPERRAPFASHLAASRQRFYDHPGGGVGAFMDRYARSRRHAPEVLAAELYVQTVSAPQLFLEGNSRTAALIASYCLARAGQPPLVITPEALRAYHQFVERGVAIDRDGIKGMLGFGVAVRELTRFLRNRPAAGFLAPPLETPARAPS